ncbi:MAG: hypothetical protein Q9182_006369 [Xanthomendoza sp. 2 TL-2023]
MNAGYVKRGGPALAHLAKATGNLRIDESSSETQTSETEKGNNRRGRQKKTRKSGHTSTGSGAGSRKANDDAENDNDSVPLYEIKESENKGLGVFATRDISCGTRIMCERPLIHVERDDEPCISTRVRELPAEERDKFYSLSGYRPEGQKAETERLYLRQGYIDSRVISKEDHPITKIYETYSYKTDSGVVVCLDLGRINHSCLPNVFPSWNNHKGRVTVHAMQNIAKGQEILMAHISVCQSRAERRWELLERWQFICQCRACSLSSAFWKASDGRRERLQELVKLLEWYSELAPPQIKEQYPEASKAVREMKDLPAEEGIDDANWELA